LLIIRTVAKCANERGPAAVNPELSRPGLDVVIVGAGFAGLYLLPRLRGLGMKARIIEDAGANSTPPDTNDATREPGASEDVTLC
jgi:hypothetical protein